MSLREQMKRARILAGLSQLQLATSAGWDDAHVSRFETGKKSAGYDKIERWMKACEMKLVPVPIGAVADPIEFGALSDDQKKLVLQLVRLLPTLSKDDQRTLRGLLRSWGEDAEGPESEEQRASLL